MIINKVVEHLSSVGMRVPAQAWDETVRFYVDVVGLNLVERNDDLVLLRAKRERKRYTVALIKSDRPGMEFALWKVPEDGDLDIIEERARKHGIATRRVEPGEIPDVSNGLELIDFGGHRMIYTATAVLQDFAPEPYRGASVHGIDHLNVNYSTGLEAARRFYMDELGLGLTFALVIEDEPRGYWFRASQRNHDFAIGAGGDFFHHLSFRVLSPDDVRRACDMFSDLDYPIECGPGAHAPMGQYFIYLKDPAGNRIEIFADEVQNWDHWEPEVYTEKSERYPINKLLARWGQVPAPEFFTTGT